jgi:hypothetical protein
MGAMSFARRRANLPDYFASMYALSVVEWLGISGFCAWVAITRPQHVLGWIAFAVSLLNIWLMAGFFSMLLARRVRGGGGVDAEAQRRRVEEAMRVVAQRAGLRRPPSIAARGLTMAPVTLRRSAGRGWVLRYNPAAVAAYDDDALLGTLALQVANGRRLGPRSPRALALGICAMLPAAALFAVVTMLAGDGQLALALTAAFGPWVIMPGVALLARLVAIMASKSDAEAVEIAGGANVVLRGVEAQTQLSEQQRAAMRRTPAGIGLLARLATLSLLWTWVPVQRRRLEALRRMAASS